MEVSKVTWIEGRDGRPIGRPKQGSLVLPARGYSPLVGRRELVAIVADHGNYRIGKPAADVLPRAVGVIKSWCSIGPTTGLPNKEPHAWGHYWPVNVPVGSVWAAVYDGSSWCLCEQLYTAAEYQKELGAWLDRQRREEERREAEEFAAATEFFARHCDAPLDVYVEKMRGTEWLTKKLMREHLPERMKTATPAEVQALFWLLPTKCVGQYIVEHNPAGLVRLLCQQVRSIQGEGYWIRDILASLDGRFTDVFLAALHSPSDGVVAAGLWKLAQTGDAQYVDLLLHYAIKYGAEYGSLIRRSAVWGLCKYYCHTPSAARIREELAAIPYAKRAVAKYL